MCDHSSVSISESAGILCRIGTFSSSLAGVSGQIERSGNCAELRKELLSAIDPGTPEGADLATPFSTSESSEEELLTGA